MTILLLYVLYAIVLSVVLERSGHHWKPVEPDAANPKRPSRILIIGATGGTGKELVKQGLERGYEVTALVREPSRLQIDDPKLKVIKGDVLDPSSVEAAMRGQDAVLSALGHKRFFYPNRILSDGTRNIVKAMKAQGVKRLICETSLGIGDSAGRMGLYYTFFVIPVILPFYFYDKTRQERNIAKSGLEWIIVRPVSLTNAPGKGGSRHGKDVGSFILTRRISRADVAAFMLEQLESDKYLHSSPGVCG